MRNFISAQVTTIGCTRLISTAGARYQSTIIANREQALLTRRSDGDVINDRCRRSRIRHQNRRSKWSCNLVIFGIFCIEVSKAGVKCQRIDRFPDCLKLGSVRPRLAAIFNSGQRSITNRNLPLFLQTRIAVVKGREVKLDAVACKPVFRTNFKRCYSLWRKG